MLKVTLQPGTRLDFYATRRKMNNAGFEIHFGGYPKVGVNWLPTARGRIHLKEILCFIYEMRISSKKEVPIRHRRKKPHRHGCKVRPLMRR